MPVIFRIAVRNLRDHRAKTLIVGIIIAVGIMVMTVGTSLIDTATKGIEEHFIENYTGNILIGGISEDDLSIFGVQSPGGVEETPTLPNAQKILDHLAANSQIINAAPQITGFASVTVENQENPDARGMTLLFGIEPDSYHAMFERIEVEEGHFLGSDEAGIMLSQTHRERIEEELDTTIEIGDKILVTGFNTIGIKIREVEVVGIYKLLSDTEGFTFASYIDLATLRALKGLNLGASQTIVLDEGQTSLLESESFDDLFGENGFGESVNEIGEMDWSNKQIFLDPISEPGMMGEAELFDPFAGSTTANDTEEEALLPEDSAVEAAAPPLEGGLNGSVEFILVELKNYRRTARVTAELNAWFLEEGIAAQAMDWKGAAGPFSSTADVIRTVFNVAVLLVAFVALIIITNTLLISVLERKKEIGTMRAIGAGKGFVTAMFTSEITVIALIFGILGELAGLGVLGIIHLIGFEAGNSLVEILFAGKTLVPVIKTTTLGYNLLTVVVIGIIANIYPVSVALKIQPVKAIASI